ncbi:MAG: DUF3187 family protein [Woeseiaceae bacterium]
MLLGMGVVLLPGAALAEQPHWQGFPLRNQNPFLQIFGLPTFQSGTLVAEGSTQYELSLDIVNHADAASSLTEDFEVDGESYFFSLSMRRRFSAGLELGFELPLVAHATGFLDGFIENWHSAFGLSNAKRRNANNQLYFSYAGASGSGYQLNSSAFGLGDLQLTAAIPVRQATAADGLSVALRASVKLPTGDSEKLLGSGAADYSIGAYLASRQQLLKRDLDLSGFVGTLFLTDGDILPDIQRSSVPYGGMAATWHATERLGITAQLFVQRPYFNTALEELGGNSMQLAVGGQYRPRAGGIVLSFAIVEDVSTNATPDLGLHASLRTRGAR